MNNLDLSTKLEGVVNDIVSSIKDSLTEQIKELVIAEVHKQVGYMQVNSSIGASSATITGMISGDQIQGGIIKEFGSTGIDDQATACVLTLLDESVVIENNLLTKDLTVQGNLDVKGTVTESSALFKQIADYVSKSVDAKILPTVKEDWVSSVPDVPVKKGLQTEGENLLDGTLYVHEKKVGINTIAPAAALTIRDHDTELRIGRLRYGAVQIVAPGSQNLIIGSGHQQNIILADDGTTLIEGLYVGGPVKLTSATSIPKGEGETGHIVFNANPSIGGPMGWVCLGGETWANLPVID
jgi:hypothetical protein